MQGTATSNRGYRNQKSKNKNSNIPTMKKKMSRKLAILPATGKNRLKKLNSFKPNSKNKTGNTKKSVEVKYHINRPLTDYETTYLTTHGVDESQTYLNNGDEENNILTLSTSLGTKGKTESDIESIFKDALGNKTEFMGTVVKKMESGGLFDLGRPKSAIARDRKYLSQEPHEQAYLDKRKKLSFYKTKEEGGSLTTIKKGQILKDKKGEKWKVLSTEVSGAFMKNEKYVSDKDSIFLTWSKIQENFSDSMEKGGKTKTKSGEIKVESYLPIFPGFYNTLFQADEERVIEEPYTFDDYEFNYKKYEKEVAQEATEVIQDWLEPYDIKINFQSVSSPREYNFGNDSINVEYVLANDSMDKILEYLNENREDFEKDLKERYTSRSGFMSSHSNDADEWISDLKSGEDLSHKLGSVLEFILKNERYTDEDLYNKVSDNVYLEGEVKEEAMEYAKYAEKYLEDNYAKKSQEEAIEELTKYFEEHDIEFNSRPLKDMVQEYYEGVESSTGKLFRKGGGIKGKVEIGETLYATTGVPVKVLEYNPLFGGRVKIERAGGYEDEWTRKASNTWRPLSKFHRTNPMDKKEKGGAVKTQEGELNGFYDLRVSLGGESLDEKISRAIRDAFSRNSGELDKKIMDKTISALSKSVPAYKKNWDSFVTTFEIKEENGKYINEFIKAKGGKLNKYSDKFVEVEDSGSTQYYIRTFGKASTEDTENIELLAVAQIDNLEDAISEEELATLEGQYQLNITIVPTEKFISKKLKKESNSDNVSISGNKIVNLVSYMGGLNYEPQKKVYFKTHEEALEYLKSKELNDIISVNGAMSGFILDRSYNRIGTPNWQILKYMIGESDKMFAKGGDVTTLTESDKSELKKNFQTWLDFAPKKEADEYEINEYMKTAMSAKWNGKKEEIKQYLIEEFLGNDYLQSYLEDKNEMGKGGEVINMKGVIDERQLAKITTYLYNYVDAYRKLEDKDPNELEVNFLVDKIKDKFNLERGLAKSIVINSYIKNLSSFGGELYNAMRKDGYDVFEHKPGLYLIRAKSDFIGKEGKLIIDNEIVHGKIVGIGFKENNLNNFVFRFTDKREENFIIDDVNTRNLVEEGTATITTNDGKSVTVIAKNKVTKSYGGSMATGGGVKKSAVTTKSGYKHEKGGKVGKKRLKSKAVVKKSDSKPEKKKRLKGNDKWYYIALEELKEYEGDDAIKIQNPDWGYGGFEATNGDRDWFVFKAEDDAKAYAINQVKEQLVDEPELFTESWLLDNIDKEKAESFFKQIYDEHSRSYANDILNESYDGEYANRLAEEMYERKIISEKDAKNKKFDFESKIDDFVENYTQEAIDEGNGGYDYYKQNFGDDEAKKIIKDNNLINIDEASEDAISVDGIGHFISHWDGKQIDLPSGAVAYKN